MTSKINEFNQPIGPEILDWHGAASPDATSMTGRFCAIETMNVARHARDLFDAFTQGDADGLWTYMSVGPFENFRDFENWMNTACTSTDPLFYTLIDRATGRAVGFSSYLRIVPAHGVIEAGNIAFSPRLQRTPIATEAIFLMLQHAFNMLGYRRFEWKCDALNAPSRRAAERFGFSYDGMFKQALIYKGRNRDTAWFSILDRDWPAIERGFKRWLDAGNFGPSGRQINRLSDLITDARAKAP